MNDFVKRLAKLPADRRAQLLALLREEPDETGVPAAPVAREREASAALSFGQETLWFVNRLAPEIPTYNTPIVFRLTGTLDADAFRAALRAVVARHEMLRTAITEGTDGPVQSAAANVPVELPVRELPGADAGARRAAADARVAELTTAPFDLATAPLWRAELLRTGETEHLFVFVVHHVVFDGWSLGVLCAELTAGYRAALAGEPLNTTPPELDYVDYARWQRDHLDGDRLTEQTDFWRERLDGAPVLEFPTDRPRPPELSYRGAALHRFVPADVGAAAETLARSLSTTPNAVYTAAFVTLLHRYTGQDDLVFGAPTANREYDEIAATVGYFINMLVLRADASGDPTFRELVGRVRDTVLDAFAHGSLPFGKLVEAIRPARDASRSPLFQLVFTYQNADGEFTLPGLTTERIQIDPGISRFDMSWNVYPTPDGLDLTVEYSTDLFDAETVDALVTDFAAVLRAAVADPGLRLSRVPLLDEERRRSLREDFNGPRRAVPAVTVPELFARQVAARGEETAVVFGADRVSYLELDRRSTRLAHLLRDAGAGPDRRVALCLPRVPDLIVAMLAVLKAGAAYVPVDPTHPTPRVAAILADCDPVAVLTTGDSGANLPELAVPVLRLDALDAAPETPVDPTAGPENLAYVIYTSGSTGTPKGVLVEHHAVVNFIGSVQDLFDLTADDRVLGFAAATFDVSVFETFSALLTGARLYLTADDERLDVDRLQDLLAREAITVTDLPPSLMALLEPEKLPALRVAFVGGEAFPGELVNRWNAGRYFYNGYGPTECTVTMIVQECAGTWHSSPPIGLPMANHVAHVLDPAGEPVPFGVAGELVIGGAGLARGYLNRPELTAEKFYADPFGTAPGGRLYRTGDLVKRRRDGALVFLGRIDAQVKIRGLRIEPGEIEAVLSTLPEVDQVAVEPYTDERGVKHLVGYVAGRDTAPDPAALRAWLAGQLPSYLVPAQLVVLDTLPLTSSGKVDRRLLPAPELGGAPTGPAEYASELERALATDIIGPVLGLTEVDPAANFFELGGHSLAAARVLSRIRREYSIEMSLTDFFRGPTVRALAELVAERRGAGGGDDELLDLLESMTDEEAAALLTGPAGGDGAGRP